MSSLAYPQRVGTKHPNDQKYQKYKHYYETHHHHVETNDFCTNGLFWLFMLVLIGGFIAIFVVGLTREPTRAYVHPPVILSKDAHTVDKAVLRRDSPDRTQCTTGEVFDADANRCGPTFHAPLAFDGTIMDTQTPPCNSFYRAMCGRWNDEHLNDNRAFSYGFRKNQRLIDRIIQGETEMRNGVIASTPQSSTSPVTDFYRSCIRASERHRARRKDAVLEHQHMLRKMLGGASSVADMPAVFGRLARAGYTLPFALSIERHPTEPHMLPLFTWDGFPATLSEEQIILIYRQAQDVHRLNILEFEHHVQSVASIMRACRLHSRRPLSDIRDYAAYVRDDFPNDVMRFDALPQAWHVHGHEPMRGAWHTFFQELDGTGLRFHHDQPVWVIDKPYFDWLFTFGLEQFTFRDWYAFVEFSVLYNGHDFVPDLPSDVYFQQHDQRGPLGPGGRLYNRMPRAENVSHTPTNVETKCARITQHLLPGLVAAEFLTHHFPNKEAVKDDVRTMVRGVIDAFVGQVQSTSWLSPHDKDTLVRKMRATLVRVAEPNQWEPEPFAERISQDLYWHNLNMVRAYRVERNLALWSRDNVNAFDRSAVAFFAMPLTSVNAYYSGPTNTITVLAGILQHPFYNGDYNVISKHAILGSILGHELSHMADNHGLYWGPQGSLHVDGILSPAGMEEFYRRTACVVREYGPAPMGCEAANAHYGNSTLGEDLADLTGIELAWLAYLKAHPKATLADRQHFFMVLAQAFCEHYDQEHLCEAVANDVHAIAMFRINRTFRNLDQFQRAFSCHEGQGMWKAVGDRCRVYGV